MKNKVQTTIRGKKPCEIHFSRFWVTNRSKIAKDWTQERFDPDGIALSGYILVDGHRKIIDKALLAKLQREFMLNIVILQKREQRDLHIHHYINIERCYKGHRKYEYRYDVL